MWEILGEAAFVLSIIPMMVCAFRCPLAVLTNPEKGPVMTHAEKISVTD
ncbi:hypothetical protein [Leifsonia sp. 2MCAF36]